MGRDPRVLVTGADGQVGRALRRVIPSATLAGRGRLDVTDADAVAAAVTGHDVVVHLAAATNVDACESHPGEAERVNVGGTRNVAAAAELNGAYLVLLSTDYVFDGQSRTPYREDDERAPLNVYGATKRDAEDIVHPLERSLVLRTSWVFGDGRNFIRAILAAARASDNVHVVHDQRATPTPADGVAQAVRHAIDVEMTGRLHVAGDGDIVSWADLAGFILEQAGTATRVEPVTSDEYAASRRAVTAPRPSFSALDLGRARAEGVPLLDWRTAVTAYVEGEA